MTLCCPTCGHEIEQVPAKALREVPMPHQERTILDALAQAYPRPTTLEHLAHCLYGDRADGGPDTGYQVVRTRISHLRKVLSALGWSISKYGYGSSGRYRLEKIED